MIYTEDEAKTKWCPFVRQAFTPDNTTTPVALTAVNRSNVDVPNGQLFNCLGAGRAAWRWLTINQHGTGVSIGREGDIATGPKSKGYCGLAGGIGK